MFGVPLDWYALYWIVGAGILVFGVGAFVYYFIKGMVKK